MENYLNVKSMINVTNRQTDLYRSKNLAQVVTSNQYYRIVFVCQKKIYGSE